MPIKKYPNTQVTETDPSAVKLADVENTVSTSTTKVPTSGLLKTTKEALESSIASKANSTHSHIISDSTGLQTALDLKADASALTSGLATKASSSHSHAQSEVTNLVTDLADKAPQSNTYTKAEVDSAIAGAGGGNGTAFTLGGTVAIGDLIETYNDAGTYKAKKITGEAGTLFQDVNTNFTATLNSSFVYYPTQNCYVFVGPSSLVSNYLQTIVMTASGATITAQSAVSQVSLAVSGVKAFYDSDQDAIIVCYMQSGGTAGIYIAKLTVSGTTATLSTPQLVTTSTNFSTFQKITTDKYVVGVFGSSVTLKFYCISVSGSTFTVGAQTATPTADSVNYMTVCWDSLQSKLFVFYIKNTSAPQYFCYAVYTLSGTTFTLAQTDTNLRLGYDITPHWQSFYDSGYIYIYSAIPEQKDYSGFIRYTVSVNTLTQSDSYPLSKIGATLSQSIFTKIGNDIYLFANNSRTLVHCQIVSNKVAVIKRLYFKNYATLYYGFAVGTNESIHLIGTAFKTLKADVFTALSTTSKTIGVALEAGTSGQSKKVALNGQIATGLSGLTTGTQYYIQNDGTMSQNWTPLRLGRAISDTQLSVNLFEEYIYV